VVDDQPLQLIQAHAQDRQRQRRHHRSGFAGAQPDPVAGLARVDRHHQRRRRQRLVQQAHDSLPSLCEHVTGTLPQGRVNCYQLHADKGYDNPRVRRYLRRRGITAWIARIGVDSSARLGRHRWVVERTLGWLLSYRRLALRYDRTAVTITAPARRAVILVCARRPPTDKFNVW
jgi:transposase